MSDDLDNRGAQDRARVNINEPHEVRYWTERFNVTEDQLIAAAKAVGPSAAAIAERLRVEFAE
jgi:hypothetical protein